MVTNDSVNNKRRLPLIYFWQIIPCLLGFLLFSCEENSTTAETASLHSTGSESSLLPQTVDLVTDKISNSYIVKTGDSFYSIFRKFGIDPVFSGKIFSSLKKAGLTSIYPDDSIVIHQKSDSSVSSIDLFIRLFDKFSVLCEDSLFSVHREQIQAEKCIYLLNGTVENSLSESVFSAGVGDVVTSSIMDIFAWDINFFLDPRVGDRFQIVFEKKYLNGKFIGYGTILAARYYTANNKIYSAYGMDSENGSIRYYNEKGDILQKQFLKAPLNFSRISSKFSFKRKHPVLGIVRPHLGVDYAAPGGTPVMASADGKVIFSGRKSDYGNLIILSHGGMYQTYYGHLQSFAANIRNGATVTQGQIIGRVGMTGLATGPHLDYRMKKNNSFFNPLNLSLPPLRSVTENERNIFNLIKEKDDFIFQNRFCKEKGCFLLEIQK